MEAEIARLQVRGVTYLRVRKFSELQHYKNKQNHAWVKFYVKTLEDEDLRALPVATRLLWDMLLLLACRHGNAIPNDSKRIGNLLGIRPSVVRQGIQQLLEGGWLSETQSGRKSRLPLDQSLAPVREEKKEHKGLPRGVARRPEAALTRWHDTDQFTPLVPLVGVPRLPEREDAA